MKNIELTENQKVKLLEMCRILFPEYPDLQFGVKEKHNWSKEYLVFGLTGNEPIIHWFEFCMTHLIVKLSKEFTKQGLSKADYTDNQYPNWFSEKVSYHLNPFRNEEFEEDILFIHPIDYLYEEFKKLKK